MISVIYLSWAKLGEAVLRRFLDSYQQFPASADHELIVVMKEYPAPTELSVKCYQVYEAEPCLNVPAFYQIAFNVQSDFVCCLNTESVILADDWLAKMHFCASQPGVGMVGATGSWESHLNNAIYGIGSLGIDGRDICDLHHIVRDKAILYPAFPNYHLRTTAFMMRRETFLSMPYTGGIMDKERTLQNESGWDGLSRKLTDYGQQLMVVDRNGQAWPKECWPQSNTFRRQDQQGLLISDKQTDVYERAGPEERRRLELTTWGKLCKPC